MNIEEKIKGILCELSGLDSIETTAHLQEDIALDSLMMVTMLVEIEEAFDIQLDEADMNPFELNPQVRNFEAEAQASASC